MSHNKVHKAAEMFPLYFVLVAGSFCLSSADIHQETVLQNTVATLPCPHKKGDVIWSRYLSGDRATLVTIKNGLEKKKDRRYGSLADNSLVITNVTSFDTTTYFCNDFRVYLEVTSDPSPVIPKAGNVPVTPRTDGPGQKGITTEAENHQPDSWKVPVGVVVVAAMLLFVTLILRFCSKNREERNPKMDKTAPEVIYAEIEDVEEQPGRESYFESPYYWTRISETPSTSTPPSNTLYSTALYSTVNKRPAGGHSREECVYSLAQNPESKGM
ncbi:uncharacterized protein LOC115006461 [Cottoperca gobio]|uniref:Uncharacterized protein LOC115006461 n=1 Tax=Cottoperca gobio TaxID=56716 RepID=A0A6J2PEU1_COTGO|nr:uncharacterized protein LOC115006461 [Cottoperca gobio]